MNGFEVPIEFVIAPTPVPQDGIEGTGRFLGGVCSRLGLSPGNVVLSGGGGVEEGGVPSGGGVEQGGLPSGDDWGEEDLLRTDVGRCGAGVRVVTYYHDQTSGTTPDQLNYVLYLPTNLAGAGSVGWQGLG